jgi:crotonobetaine/carnitine-CoA ligase
MNSATTLFDHLDVWAEQDSHRELLRFGADRLTYTDAAQRVNDCALWFRGLGVEKGQRVAIMAPTSVDVLIAMLAVARLGAIVVPLNIFLKGDPLIHQLKDSGATVIIADQDGAEVVTSVVTALPELRKIVVTDGAECRTTGIDIVTLDTNPSVEGDCAALPVLDRDDTFAILYTSGTTGLPKGCVISHAYAVHWGLYTEEYLGIQPDDVLFTAAPLFHISGLTPLLGAVRCGVPVAMTEGFSASSYFETVRTVGATIAIGVGWIAQALLSQPERDSDRGHPLRALSTVQLAPEECAAFESRFGAKVLVHQYGQTECYPVSYARFEENDAYADAGPPARFLEVGVHDESGREAPAGEPGEIVVRPRERGVMFERYWNDPVRTASAFEGLWYHTGDRGVIVDGSIRFVDRKKDSIRRRGENVSAFELERALFKHPAVDEVAVFGVTVEGEIDQSIKACLVESPGNRLDLRDLLDHLASEVPYFAIPRFVEVLAELPRNASGRVMKDILRADWRTESTVDLEEQGLTLAKEFRRGIRGRQTSLSDKEEASL